MGISNLLNPPSLLERLRAFWKLKLLLLSGLTILFCVPYIFLAHHRFFPLHDIPMLPPDR